MEKIQTMYERDEAIQGHPVKPGVKPSCAWVEAGEGVATRKLDGTNVKIENGFLFKRRKPKSGDYDRASYVKCDPVNPADKWLFRALSNSPLVDGIYEACGPKIQGNPEQFEQHVLVRVVPPDLEMLEIKSPPRQFHEFYDFFRANDIEGIVFHHPDGRLAKIKARDFGIKRGVR